MRSTGGTIHTWEGTADGQGRYKLVPPDEATQSFNVVVAAQGYVPGRVATTSSAKELEVKLARADVIGGVVRDEQGRPIAGARVYPMARDVARDEQGRPVAAAGRGFVRCTVIGVLARDRGEPRQRAAPSPPPTRKDAGSVLRCRLRVLPTGG